MPHTLRDTLGLVLVFGALLLLYAAVMSLAERELLSAACLAVAGLSGLGSGLELVGPSAGE